jgi:hypothetical protein
MILVSAPGSGDDHAFAGGGHDFCRGQFAGHASLAEARLAVADVGQHRFVDPLDGRHDLRCRQGRIAVVETVDVREHDE